MDLEPLVTLEPELDGGMFVGEIVGHNQVNLLVLRGLALRRPRT